jgi:hypothetical protein
VIEDGSGGGGAGPGGEGPGGGSDGQWYENVESPGEGEGVEGPSVIEPIEPPPPLVDEYSAPSNITANRLKGLAAEAAVSDFLGSNGFEVLGEQVRADTPLGTRVIDLVVRGPNGEVIAVEVKSGGASLSAEQLAKDNWINTHGVETNVGPVDKTMVITWN